MSLPRIHLRLSHKIVAIGGLGIFGLVLVAIIYTAGVQSQERHRAVAEAARTMVQGADKLGKDLLQARRVEKDFLLRSDEQFVARHGDLAKSIRADLDALRRQAAAAGRTDLEQKVDVVGAGFDRYAGHFTALADTRRKLGLNENSGLEGALRGSVHGIESKLKDFDEPRLMVTMLMMRRHEKDFMLRRDPKYGEDFKKRVAEFSKT